MKEFVKKIVKFFLRKIVTSSERIYNQTKYCFFKNRRSRVLVVVFSVLQPKPPASYNYLATLFRCRVNKLFILDDVCNSSGSVGSYYLGAHGDFYFLRDIPALVSDVVKQNNINKIITIGSSKGGTSALFYGVKLEADMCIIGAPQYHIGKYLSSEKHLPILKAIMGDTSQTSVDWLNGLVKNELETAHEKKPTVFLHYSPKEHTYNDHIKDMIGDLKKNGFTVYEDNDYSYENHSDIKYFFPKYLLKILKICTSKR